MCMEFDTGASMSLVSEKTFNRVWPEATLHPTQVKLRTYSGEPLTVLGTLDIHVQHGTNEAELSLLVVKGDGPSLYLAGTGSVPSA